MGRDPSQYDSMGLADRMRSRTQALHARAEQSGFLAMLVSGRATRARYVLYLANLLTPYAVLERELQQYADTPRLGALADASVYRAAAIESDLDAIAGIGWRVAVPVLAEAERYAERVSSAARNGGERLIAHAYTRYLGDLNGGRILGQLLRRSLGLEEDSLSFYRFQVSDLDALRARYRAAIDAAGVSLTDEQAVVEEAALAFESNIDLSRAVAHAHVRHA